MSHAHRLAEYRRTLVSNNFTFGFGTTQYKLQTLTQV